MARFLSLACLILALAVACRPTPAPAPEATPAPASAAEAPVHDPAHPPIDCPLRKAGIDPGALKPFDDVEKYIAFLDRPDRAVWQRPDDVIAALGLHGDESIADVGAGSGYFTFRLARAVPRGRVTATDLEPDMLRHVFHRSMAEGTGNVAVALARPDDPAVPPGTDLVFVCDVLHHVQDRATWLGKAAAAMKPGARLVLVEFKEGALPEGPPESLKLTRAQLVALAQAAGLLLAGERPDLLPYQSFLVFQKP
jgi:SAM-dependent methyltransferase